MSAYIIIVYLATYLFFREIYPKCRAYIDATEIRVQRTKIQEGKVIGYSSYKAADTMKLFIACAPDGTITFLSQCFGGGVSDSVQCVKSGFLKLLEPGDLILADKGTY